MAQPLSDALRLLRKRPRLILGLAATNLLWAALTAQPLSWSLIPIDVRPAASALVRGDDALGFELLLDHPELLRSAFGALLWSLPAYSVLAWILAGGILASSFTGQRGARALFHASIEHAGAMVKLGLLGLSLRLFPVGLLVGLGALLSPLEKRLGYLPLVGLALFALTLAGILWSLGTVVLDAARGVLVARTTSARAALALGLRALGQRKSLWARLALLSAVGYLVLTGVLAVLDGALPAATSLGEFARMCSGVLIELVRATLTTTLLVAAGLASTMTSIGS